MSTRVIHWASLVLIPALLVGIFTVRWPGTVLVALAAAGILAVVGFVWRRRLDTVGWLILANYGLWLISGLVIGGVTFRSLIEPGFYNGIGRIFLYYLPLLAFSALAVKRIHLRTVWRTMLGLSGFTLVLLIGWFCFRVPGANLSHENHIWTTPFIGLLTSTTGAGTLAGACWLFIEIQARRRQDWRLTAVGLPWLAFMATTTSRQAILASFATLGLFILLERRWRLIFGWFVYAFVVVLVLLAARPQNLYKFANMVSPRMVGLIDQASAWSATEAQSQLRESAKEGGRNPGVNDLSAHTGDRMHNIRTRLILWRRALARFSESPLLGIGFARFNDIDRRWVGLRHVVWLAAGGRRVYAGQLSAEEDQVGGSGSAHNSYLHVLAETGLVGLALLGALWAWLAMRLTRGFRLAREAGDHAVADYFQAARLLLVFVLLGALVGHALAAPSVGVIVMTIAGVGLAYERQMASREF